MVFIPTMTVLWLLSNGWPLHGRKWPFFQRSLHRKLQTPATLAVRAAAISSVSWRGLMYSCQAAQPASQGAGEAGQCTSQPLFLLPQQEVQRASPLRASWPPPVHKPSKSGWTACFPFSVSPWSLVRLLVEAIAAGTNSPLIPFFMWCCQNSVGRSKRQTLPQLLMGKLFQLKETWGRECLHCSNLTHFCCLQERSTNPF